MKIKNVLVKNFRSYKNEVKVSVDDLTAFVGRNDIGKSTILEALDIFFYEGKGTIKIDFDDVNKELLALEDTDIMIGVEFIDLPPSIVIDTSNATTLAEEFLLTTDGTLEILKVFPKGGKPKVYFRANHPTNENCDDLLLKTNTQLKALLGDDIECEDRTKNAVIRKAIWGFYSEDLQLKEVELDSSKGEVKDIWSKINAHMPYYALFQSDRKNSDGDSEIQDPMKLAVREIMSDPDLQKELNKVAEEVNIKLRDVSNRTLGKLRELNDQIADELNPIIPPSEELKWIDVFKNVSIAGNENIPINKRGSGVKRLILISFFRAEAERRQGSGKNPDIVYAIEEPETSQHSDHQKVLIEAIKSLSKSDNTQVILTTHSSTVVKELEFSQVRLIQNGAEGKLITSIEPNEMPYPSLNEVNYLAFGDACDEYHNELYGYIEEQGLLTQYRNGKNQRLYKKLFREAVQNLQVCLTDYIRHQIHHPENTMNPRFTASELTQSISDMRDFIVENK